MIQLDNEYTTTKAAEGGQYEKPPAGGYILKCVEVSEKPSNAGNAMVTLSFDIAEGEYTGAFGKFPKKFFQLVNGEHLPYFKGMLKAFQESNPEESLKGLVNGLNFDATRLVGRKVGASIREAEYKDKDGKLNVGVEIYFLCPVKEVPNIKPASLKKLKDEAKSQPSGPRPSAPISEDLPF